MSSAFPVAPTLAAKDDLPLFTAPSMGEGLRPASDLIIDSALEPATHFSPDLGIVDTCTTPENSPVCPDDAGT